MQNVTDVEAARPWTLGDAGEMQSLPSCAYVGHMYFWKLLRAKLHSSCIQQIFSEYLCYMPVPSLSIGDIIVNKADKFLLM